MRTSIVLMLILFTTTVQAEWNFVPLRNAPKLKDFFNGAEGLIGMDQKPQGSAPAPMILVHRLPKADLRDTADWRKLVVTPAARAPVPMEEHLKDSVYFFEFTRPGSGNIDTHTAITAFAVEDGSILVFSYETQDSFAGKVWPTVRQFMKGLSRTEFQQMEERSKRAATGGTPVAL